MNLIDYLESAKKSIFRFEYLQDYEEDDNSFKDWQKTRKINKGLMKEWWDFIEGKNKKGVKTQRVRRVVFPLSEYTEMELDVHRLTAQHGDEIKIITDDVFKKLNKEVKDFLIIDDKIVLDMKYTPEGRFLGYERNENYKDYLNYKEKLLNNSISINQFLI